ncbi:ABC-three component system middle component 1 [Rhodohalobacter sp.]|uniref:ABC-three component system middle component 1 n=1 Tax=Rhodohalobacter sp. TaxID=1974210 RepID=UPI002ADC1199|nr:ABC-three component system middle component 1 [Rhodohalobacter sp.]
MKISKNLLSFFNEQKTKSSDIEKNTSLLVFAQVENLDKENHDLVKRHIWRVEEDEYFFNKSVILYDEASKNLFQGNSSLKDQLKNTVLEEGKLDAFLKNNFDDKHHFFCLQLFVKVPFLESPMLNLKSLQTCIPSLMIG